MTNIRKHAQASAVSISMFQDSDGIILEIKDNGCGFTPEDILSSSKYGLRSMRERAESINADFQIISALRMGATIRLHIPISEEMKA